MEVKVGGLQLPIRVRGRQPPPQRADLAWSLLPPSSQGAPSEGRREKRLVTPLDLSIPPPPSGREARAEDQTHSPPLPCMQNRRAGRSF